MECFVVRYEGFDIVARDSRDPIIVLAQPRTDLPEFVINTRAFVNRVHAQTKQRDARKKVSRILDIFESRRDFPYGDHGCAEYDLSMLLEEPCRSAWFARFLLAEQIDQERRICDHLEGRVDRLPRVDRISSSFSRFG
jgi:hypothetical protein